MSRIVDLTLPLHNAMPGVEIEPIKSVDADGWNATTLHLYSHCGTHMDAPQHFGVTDQTIDQLPLEMCMGPAWLVNLSGIEPHSVIGVEHVRSVENKLGPGDSLLLRTDWSRLVDTAAYRDDLPRVSLDLARWCAERRIRMLGVEPPSVADVNNMEEITAVHSALLGGGVVIVEGLANLDKIKAEKVTFMAFPLKIAGGDGSPARAVAVED